MSRPATGNVALRKGRVSLPGTVYFLTTACARRRRHFADFATACVAARVLSSPRVWADASLLAWVLMPDHWHGLVVVGERYSLSTLMQRAKTNSSRDIAISTGIAGPIWQAGFHDHALRADEDLAKAARYLVANPIRAGIAADLREYPFWDACWGMETLGIG
jgi:REP element-mobilizing transposase RayT